MARDKPRWEYKPKKTRVFSGPVWAADHVVLWCDAGLHAFRIGEKKPRWSIATAAGGLSVVDERVVVFGSPRIVGAPGPARRTTEAFAATDGTTVPVPDGFVPPQRPSDPRLCDQGKARPIARADGAIAYYLPKRVLICADAESLAERWRAEHPLRVLWDSAPVIQDGRVYAFGSSRRGSIHAFDLRTGQPVLTTGKGTVEHIAVAGELVLARSEHGRSVAVYEPAGTTPLPKPTSKTTTRASGRGDDEVLTKALAVAPSRRAFSRIVRLLGDRTGTALEAGIEQACAALEGWADEFRVSPPDWLQRVLSGENEPRVVLARTLPKKRLRARTTLAGARAFAALQLVGDRLSLRDPDLPAEALQVLAELGRHPRLDLGGSEVGHAGARILAEAPGMAVVEALDLSRTGLEADGAGALASSPHLTNLGCLGLHGNAIGDAGATALAKGNALSRLGSLDVRRCQIGDAGCEALASATWRLEDFEWDGNPFGARGALALSESETLPEYVREMLFARYEELRRD